MSRKITFIGAGSFGFTRALVRDLMTFPALRDAHICLMDVNPERLEMSARAVGHIIKAGGYPATVTTTADRAKALEGADGVLCTILCGGPEIWKHDILIPQKYGIDINVGDTRGPSGIFRFLRTAPVLLAIARDIQTYCPDAVFLNYTNPMAMLCRVVQSETKVLCTGLCHSVQGTAEMLARWLGADMADVSYRCAGINHQAFYLDFRIKGEDAYPRLREAVLQADIYNQEIVRNEMFKTLDYFVTESSGHNSEYVAWFRKRPELIEKYCLPGTGWNPGVHGYTLSEYQSREGGQWQKDFEAWMAEKPDLARGREYASYIFNAVFGDNTPFEFNGNVRNNGIIDNLPAGCCVEVPVFASKSGLSPVKIGALPPQLALLTSISAQIEEMAVAGFLEKDAHKIYQAICFDPLTEAVLSLEEIRGMVRDLFTVNRAYLPEYDLDRL